MFNFLGNKKKKVLQDVQLQTLKDKQAIIQTITEGLREMAMQEFNKIPVPGIFTDPLLFQLFEDPVMTSYGRIYSRRSITRHLESISSDPLTNEPLLLSQLHQVPKEIRDILDELKELQEKTKEKIQMAKDSDMTGSLLSGYRLRLVQLEDLMNKACKNQVTQACIQQIKNNLKIDSTNIEHVNFWKSKGKFGVTIPDHVQKMMVAANDDTYDSVEDFLQAVNAERRSSSCGKVFKFFLRDPSTRSLYNQEDEKLKTYLVR